MNSDLERKSRIDARATDFVLYIGIGIVFVGVTFAVELKWGHEVFIKWVGLAGFSAVLFGYFIADTRLLFRRWSFWALTTILLCGHSIVLAIILTHIEQWKIIWFTGMIFELPVFIFFRNMLQHSS